MLKFRKTALSITAALLSSFTMADENLNTLQSEIDALNAKLNSPQVVQTSPNLASMSQDYQHGQSYLDKDDGFYIDAQPSVTYELAILKEEQQHPFEGLKFGGYFEQDVQYWNGDSLTTTDNTIYHRGMGLYFTSLNLDFLAKINDWTSILMRPEMQNLGTSSESVGMHDIFLTFGNLSKFPLYATIGKTYLPFGAFPGGGLWAAPLTRIAFRPGTGNQLIFGYYEQGLGTSLSFFDRSSFSAYPSDFAYRLGYNTDQGKWTYGGGFSYLNDLRGTSSGLGSQFASGGSFNSSKNARNPVLEVNGTIGYGLFQLDAEWLSTQHQIFTTAGANQGRPQAWNIDGSISPDVYGEPLTFMLAYSHTSHMQNTPMGLSGETSPGRSVQSGFSNQWIATVSREMLEGYFLGLEVARDKLYNGQKTYELTLDSSFYF